MAGDTQENGKLEPGPEETEEPTPPVLPVTTRFRNAISPVLARTWTRLKNRPSLITSAGLIAFCTIATLVATTANVLIVWGQLQEMKSSGADAHNLVLATQNLASHAKQQASAMDGLRRAAEAQAKATNDLREVASRQVDATIGQSSAIASGNALNRTAYRPWVGLAGVDADQPTQTKTGLKISWKATNAGRTPAQIILFVTASDLYEKFPSEPPYKTVTEGSKSVVVPGQDIFVKSTTSPLNEATLAMISSGKRTYYLYASVVYTEVGGKQRYVTRACSRYDPKLTMFVGCSFHNDAT